MSKVVVIGQNYMMRLGMIRIAGRLGHDVTAIKTISVKTAIDSCSKYVKDFLTVKATDRQELMDTILSLADKSQKTVLIPLDDYCASVIDDNIELLKEDFLFPNIEMRQGAINRMMDKDLQKELAVKSGFHVAKGWIIQVKNGKYTIPDEIKFPCFPKPQESILASKTCMRRCNNKQELENAIKPPITKNPNCSFLVEEYISIDKEYATLGFSDGKNVVIPATILLLEEGKGRQKGVTIRGKVIGTDEYSEFFERLKHYIQSIHFVGLFDVDSYVSGGKMYFNELNLRFGASGLAITKMGVNLPEMLINCLLGQPYDTQQIIKNEGIFVSEKVAYEQMLTGFISPWRFKKYLKDADFLFIPDDDDMEPYNQFLNLGENKFICLVKFFLRKLGLRW